MSYGPPPPSGYAQPPYGPPTGYMSSTPPVSQAYAPQQAYGPPGGYAPQPGYGGQAGYPPAHGRVPSSAGYGSGGGRQGYDQQLSYGRDGRDGRDGYGRDSYRPGGAAPGGTGAGRGRGQRYARGAPPPVGADPQLWQWFTAVDVDQSGAISAQELQRALLNGDWSHFDLDTVKMLMTLFDVDRSGTITFDEFAGLWKYIRDWQNVFRHFDVDRSGSIDGRELRNALEQFGYRLTPRILYLLEMKYDLHSSSSQSTSSSSHSHSRNAASLPRGEGRIDLQPGMTFDRFVRACVVTKHLTDAFQRMDDDRDGWVRMDYETFMAVVLTAP